jgi:hypothetical protein
MKDRLTELGMGAVWRKRSVPKDWRKQTQILARSKCKADGDVKMDARPTMKLFNTLGASTVKGWLYRAVDHPGVALRFRLRCSGAPLMAVVGGNHGIPMQERTCRFCNAHAVEDAEHFVSKCSFYADERRECIARLNAAIAGEWAPGFRQAMDEETVELFLGDKLLLQLPEEKRRQVDAVLCDYLKVAWRKRNAIWATLTERQGWRLR